jgi:hypothetical protein
MTLHTRIDIVFSGNSWLSLSLSLSRRVADALSHCVEVESMKRVMQSRGFTRSQGEPVDIGAWQVLLLHATSRPKRAFAVIVARPTAGTPTRPAFAHTRTRGSTATFDRRWHA